MLDLCAVNFRDQSPECIVSIGVRGPMLPQDWRDGDQGFAFHTSENAVYLIPLGVEFSLNPATVTDQTRLRQCCLRTRAHSD